MCVCVNVSIMLCYHMSNISIYILFFEEKQKLPLLRLPHLTAFILALYMSLSIQPKGVVRANKRDNTSCLLIIYLFPHTIYNMYLLIM